MRLVVPNSQRINRGGMVLSELVETCRNHDFTDIVILHEHRGEPGEGHASSYGSFCYTSLFPEQLWVQGLLHSSAMAYL